MPTFDIVCRFDPRTGDYGFSIIGPPLTLEQTIQILERGLDELRMKLIEEKNEKAERESKLKGSSGHKSSKIDLVQHESEENKEKREEAEEKSADESTPSSEAHGDDG